MTDTPSTASPGASHPAADGPTPVPTPRPRSPYRAERLVVGAVFFGITIALAVHGAWVIHRDTFRVPPPTHAIESCRAEIRDLYQRYAVLLAPYRIAPGARWSPQRPSTQAVREALARLDEELMAARPFCAREGDAARDAHTSLTLWRHLAEDHARLGEHLVTGHAERALAPLAGWARAATAPGNQP